MTTLYLHSLTVVAPAAVADATRELFKMLEQGGENSLRTGLSASGSAPATHFAAHTVITEAQRQELLSVMSEGMVDSGVRYLIVPNCDDGNVTGTNLPGFSPTGADDPQELIEAMGLKLI